MNYTIGCFHISDNDLGIIDVNFSIHHINQNRYTRDCISNIQFDHILSHHFTGNDMVKEDIGQCGNISQEGFDGTGG